MVSTRRALKVSQAINRTGFIIAILRYCHFVLFGRLLLHCCRICNGWFARGNPPSNLFKSAFSLLYARALFGNFAPSLRTYYWVSLQIPESVTCCMRPPPKAHRSCPEDIMEKFLHHRHCTTVSTAPGHSVSVASLAGWFHSFGMDQQPYKSFETYMPTFCLSTSPP